MHCKNCEHWMRNKETYEDQRFGTCDMTEDVSNHWNTKEIENNIAISSDYESYASKIETGENFGCIHFKEIKEEKQNESDNS